VPVIAVVVLQQNKKAVYKIATTVTNMLLACSSKIAVEKFFHCITSAAGRLQRRGGN